MDDCSAAELSRLAEQICVEGEVAPGGAASPLALHGTEGNKLGLHTDTLRPGVHFGPEYFFGDGGFQRWGDLSPSLPTAGFPSPKGKGSESPPLSVPPTCLRQASPPLKERGASCRDSFHISCSTRYLHDLVHQGCQFVRLSCPTAHLFGLLIFLYQHTVQGLLDIPLLSSTIAPMWILLVGVFHLPGYPFGVGYGVAVQQPIDGEGSGLRFFSARSRSAWLISRMSFFQRSRASCVACWRNW